jgi:hypothetical protein
MGEVSKLVLVMVLSNMTCLQIACTFTLAASLNLQTASFIGIYPMTLISGCSASIYFWYKLFVYFARVYEAARLAFCLFQKHSSSDSRMDYFRCVCPL